jgi:hemolysin III
VWQWLLLVVVWSGAILGVTLKFVRIDGFSRVGGALYIILGWIGIATLPEALHNSPEAPLILVGIGGLMYTFGAVVLLRRRPDPNPLVFGYHEIWHALVVAASACHFTAITMLVRAG